MLTASTIMCTVLLVFVYALIIMLTDETRAYVAGRWEVPRVVRSETLLDRFACHAIRKCDNMVYSAGALRSSFVPCAPLDGAHGLLRGDAAPSPSAQICLHTNGSLCIAATRPCTMSYLSLFSSIKNGPVNVTVECPQASIAEAQQASVVAHDTSLRPCNGRILVRGYWSSDMRTFRVVTDRGNWVGLAFSAVFSAAMCMALAYLATLPCRTEIAGLERRMADADKDRIDA